MHAYSIDYLYRYLFKKKINFLDLTGFNPFPQNIKEKGIKDFKERFNGKIIYQPSFILDNTSLLKIARSTINFFKKDKSFADENPF